MPSCLLGGGGGAVAGAALLPLPQSTRRSPIHLSREKAERRAEVGVEKLRGAHPPN